MMCYACQNGILKQTYPNKITCEACNSSWINNSLMSGSGQKYSYQKAWKAGRS